MNIKNFTLLTLVLVFVDILIKVIIETYYMETHFDIIAPYFSFHPIFNINFSYINNILSLGITKAIHLSIATIIIFLLFFFYDFIRFTMPDNKILPIALSLGLAGSLCNVIGVLFFGGILDYISLNGFFVFDLKDLYINLFIILLVYNCYKKENREKLRTANLSTYITHRISKSKNE